MLDFRADSESPYHDKNFDKSKNVIIYCASGGRSALTGKVLKDMGLRRSITSAALRTGQARSRSNDFLAPPPSIIPGRKIDRWRAVGIDWDNERVVGRSDIRLVQGRSQCLALGTASTTPL
jgi:rhodanese-related sulfurtransferase